METGARLKNRQGGAVAIMVGFSIFLLIGFLAMVIDLGHLYIAKTELQNGADAAALAGAKELDGSAPGVQDAITAAVAVARKNNFDLQNKPVGTQATEGGLIISVGSCPSDNCMVLASTITTNADAANKTFLKVDTRDPNVDRRLDTWFAPIWGILKTGTFGMAVAGRYTIQVTPMGVCLVREDASQTPHRCGLPGGPDQECGFIRGVAYNLPDLNPLSNGVPLWINPIDTAPGPCDENNGNSPIMAPFVCTGQSTTIMTLPGVVWVNTGAQSDMNVPFNSRFGDYSGAHACNPAAAQPDTHVSEFVCTKTGPGQTPDRCENNPPSPAPRDWIDTTNNTTPTIQSIEISSLTRKPFNYPTRLSPEISSNFSKYGTLWSYSKEYDFINNSEYTPSDWSNLYGGDAQSYPATSPYLASPSGTGVENRRVLNLAIIDCEHVTSIPGQQCQQTLPVLAIGKFFMQRRADLPNRLFGEFAGILAPPMPPSEIRLYR